MEHLHNTTQQLLLLSDKERIKHIKQDLWIGYTRAKGVLDKLEDLLDHPTILRMPNLLIVGDTNNGKTVLVNRFCRKYLPVVSEEDFSLNAPVVYVQAPPKPDEKRFYNNLLDVLSAPYRLNDRVEHKQKQVIEILRRINTKMLIIDEIHHILAGNMMAQRSFLNVIKYLANELQIVIVAVGIKDAFNAIQSDSQLANRFEPVTLPKWQMNEEYLRLLRSFELMLPLRNHSNLIETDIALKILSMSEGTIGEISIILKKAAVVSIEKKSEVINKKLLESLDYISPSARKRQNEQFI